eukprot:TRINITY_DN8445_c0_g2_i1.p2 TRINITY_DN8445_c0_g2~~TRINITY_DN8445_c0_g2_i1.p2  ORF type:complete len:122 (+),score=16.78 TRINITY_DN8445_c0_g2_i1:128-493(+)
MFECQPGLVSNGHSGLGDHRVNVKHGQKSQMTDAVDQESSPVRVEVKMSGGFGRRCGSQGGAHQVTVAQEEVFHLVGASEVLIQTFGYLECVEWREPSTVAGWLALEQVRSPQGIQPPSSS